MGSILISRARYTHGYQQDGINYSTKICWKLLKDTIKNKQVQLEANQNIARLTYLNYINLFKLHKRDNKISIYENYKLRQNLIRAVDE